MEPESQKEEVRQKAHSSEMGRPRLTSPQNHAPPITGCGLAGKYPPPPSLLPQDYLYLTGEKLNKQLQGSQQSHTDATLVCLGPNSHQSVVTFTFSF